MAYEECNYDAHLQVCKFEEISPEFPRPAPMESHGGAEVTGGGGGGPCFGGPCFGGPRSGGPRSGGPWVPLPAACGPHPLFGCRVAAFILSESS